MIFLTKSRHYESVCLTGISLVIGIHHDSVLAPELARWPSVIQPHQWNFGLRQPLCGQALVAGYFHSERQVCLVPWCDCGKQTYQAPARWRHFIQHQVSEGECMLSWTHFLNRLSSNHTVFLGWFPKIIITLQWKKVLVAPIRDPCDKDYPARKVSLATLTHFPLHNHWSLSECLQWEMRVS